MRRAAVVAALAAASASAGQPATPPGEPAAAGEAMGGMGMHAERTYSFTRAQIDFSRPNGRDAANWDVEGWLGGDRHKFWYKSEGETQGPRVEQAELQALYSRNLWTYFDVQGGVRYDFAPDRRGYAVIGIQGLSPYLFNSELHAFIGFRGDVSIRARQSFDLLMTNRLIVQPMLETDFYLNDARDRRVGSGFSIVEAGVQARYEVSRKFAPYVAAVYERKLGRSARFAREADENVGGWTGRVGVRTWF